jgi:phosphatidylglycerophosphate synthase
MTTTLVIVGDCPIRIWGLSAAERHRRIFARGGVDRVQGDDEPLPQDGKVVLVRADWVLEEPLAHALVAAENRLLLVDDTSRNGVRTAVAASVEAARAAELLPVVAAGDTDGTMAPPEGIEPGGVTEIGSTYNVALRKLQVPYALRLAPETLTEIEKRSFGASYKGATDFVTKFVWPWPARHVTKWCALAGIRPNWVTTLSLALVVVPMWLWWHQYFLIGVAVAWFMTFLDTVDGKLARVTLTSSKWGNLYDHGIDLLHPPFWWWAWWAGVRPVADPGLAPVLDASLVVIIAGYVLGRVMEGIFLHGFGIQSHIWRRLDYNFRVITARRNPNLFILMIGALLGAPDWGFVAVAVWVVVCLAFHLFRLLQAAAVKWRGGEIVSFLTDGIG